MIRVEKAVQYKHVLMVVCPVIVAMHENSIDRAFRFPVYEPAKTPPGAREAWILHRAAACLSLDGQEAFD